MTPRELRATLDCLDLSAAEAGHLLGVALCLGEQCEQGDVLALMLEDSDRRLQRRLTQMLGANLGEWPAD
jgi:hypothetical protein